MSTEAPGDSRDVPLYLRQDFAGGLVIIAIAAFAFWQGWELPMGTFGGMGPGMLPRGLAVLLAALGALLMLDAVLEGGERLERWSLRGPVFVLAAMVAFGAAVRPLGLVVAGPLAIVISAFASKEVRWGETLVVGAVMTVFCIGLFKFALGLPIPLAPWLIGY
jgi:putative tricarboxylic transport membrane protein